PGAGAIHVAEPGELGQERAPRPVIGVAGVALVLADVAILEMRGGERVALHVLQVPDERSHDMTRPARRYGRRALEPAGEGHEAHHEGHEADRDEQPAP